MHFQQQEGSDSSQRIVNKIINRFLIRDFGDHRYCADIVKMLKEKNKNSDIIIVTFGS